ncbi:MAG: cysteine desulfurase NifS [Clostridia bacterium]|nr:cysteine desulfurase NifS [Clostridia bacterium]
MIYLDNAGTTKVSDKVKNIMLPFLDEIYGNASSLHGYGQIAKEHLENAREKVANVLGAEAREIYFTSGGSESDNWAIESACKFGEMKGKKHIITSNFEHHAILHTLKEKEKQGFKVTYLPVYANGIIKIEDLKNAINDNTCLVTIMFANNEIGTIQPIEEIGKICKEKGIIFHTDAVQAVGHVPIDVKEMNIDMLSVSAHKFHGPKGVGVLYCKKSIPLFSFINGGAQERNRRAGTENLAGIVGLSAALEDAVNEMEEISKKEIYLRDKLFNELAKIPHSKINGDLKNRLPNNFNMSFEGIEGESLLLLLNDKGICASSGSACTSGSLDPSHVLLAIGLPHEIAHGSLRLTLSKYTTEEEIDKVIEIVPKVVKYLRDMSPVWDELIKGVRKHGI